MAKITAHCLVCNEENWIWYSIMSVIDYVDEIMVWDTGSTDKTVEIIKYIDNLKIKFKEVGKVDVNSFTSVRQHMLESTKSDWLLILDGDEIWPEKAIQDSIDSLDNNLEYLVNQNYNLIGDTFHYQDQSAGNYKIGPYFGHLNIRFINLKNIPGLHFDKPYGQEGLFDDQNQPIQNRKPFLSKLIKEPYLHSTHLKRSSQDKQVMQRKSKFKYELGIAFDEDFVYPKSLYLPTPSIIQNPWEKRNLSYLINATWQTPLKLLKRRIF